MDHVVNKRSSQQWLWGRDVAEIRALINGGQRDKKARWPMLKKRN